MYIRLIRRGLGLLGAVLLAGGLATPASAQALKRGAVFPDFNEPDMNTGKPVHLESFRGKVVLVDFWASWCGPCVAELPNVKKAYEKYHKDGFEIISISLDQTVDKCKGFVKQNEMNWNHICDGKYWKAKLAQKHGVQGIPLPVLVGKDGKIVSTEARGKELTRAIEQALKSTAEAPVDDPIDTQITARLAEADQLRDAGNYEQALKIYDELGSKYPARDGGKTANARARLLRDDPDIMKSIESQKTGAYDEEAAQGSASWLKVARQMTDQKNYKLARDYYKKIIDKYPKSKVAQTAADEMKKLPS